MNNSNETPLAQALRNWYMTPNDVHPEHILVNLDLINIMAKFRFGNRMINEAQAMVNELEMHGELTEAKVIDNDIFIIRVNLNKVKKAYDLAMN
jgi:hypothetical protein